MKEQSFDNDVNSLTGMSNSNSGAPSAIDKQAPTDAFERSWDWDFEVRELGPDETAECKVTMGADDLANLTVDGEERLDIGPRGQYGGGSYEPQTASFIIEPGMHRAHVDYSNISIPNANNNIAKFSFDLKVEITNRKTGSSSSYVPPEAETEPVDNNDEGDDDPCGGSSSGSSSSPNSSSSNPCPNGDNGGDEDETDPDNPFSPDDCMDNRGGSPQCVCRAQPGFLRLRIWKVLFRRQTGNCPDAENQHGMAHQLRFLPRYGRRAVRDAGNCGLSLLFQVVDARSPAIPASHGQLYSAPFRSGVGG